MMQNYTFRLAPGQDLFDSIEAFVVQKQVEAGCVLSCDGSLALAALRLAKSDNYSRYEGCFEIVIAVFNDVIYKREFDQVSGYDELVVHNKRDM
jgi:hypothetical protein